MSDKQLTRSQDRIIAGVAGGIADYFDTNPTLIRFLFVVLAILSSGIFGLAVYVVLWIVMPEPPAKDKQMNEQDDV